MIICKQNKGICDRQICKIFLQCWSTFNVENYARRSLCMYRNGTDWRVPGQPGGSHSTAQHIVCGPLPGVVIVVVSLPSQMQF